MLGLQEHWQKKGEALGKAMACNRDWKLISIFLIIFALYRTVQYTELEVKALITIV